MEKENVLNLMGTSIRKVHMVKEVHGAILEVEGPIIEEYLEEGIKKDMEYKLIIQ